MDIRLISVNFFFFLTLWLSIQTVSAQNTPWHLLHKLDIPGLDLMDTDNRGNLFTSNQNGIISQYDPKGDSINGYSPAFSSKLDRLETHWTANIFIYSSNLQKVEILDRFLYPISSNHLSDFGVHGIIPMATLGNNHTIWLYDESDLKLKKLNYRSNQLIQQQPLNIIFPDSALKLVKLWERNNLLFIQILDSGLSIFDNQANYIKTITLPGNLPVYIEGAYVYSLQGNHLLKINYLDGGSEKLKLPNGKYNGIALQGKRVFLKGEDKIEIYHRPHSF